MMQDCSDNYLTPPPEKENKQKYQSFCTVVFKRAALWAKLHQQEVLIQ